MVKGSWEVLDMEPKEQKAFEIQLAVACQVGEIMGRLREWRIATQPEPGRNTPPEIVAKAAAFNDRIRTRELETLRVVRIDSWWDTAPPSDVRDMLGRSSCWKNVSSAAAADDVLIRGQLASRFGISADVLAYTLPSQDEYRHIPDVVAPPVEPDLVPQEQPTMASAARVVRSADAEQRPHSGATQPAAPAPEIDEELTTALRAHPEA